MTILQLSVNLDAKIQLETALPAKQTDGGNLKEKRLGVLLHAMTECRSRQWAFLIDS